jgi:hypothetical protein
MSTWLAIVIGASLLVLFAIVSVALLVRRRNRRRAPEAHFALAEPPEGRASRATRRDAGQQVLLGERIESWTRQRAVAHPPPVAGVGLDAVPDAPCAPQVVVVESPPSATDTGLIAPVELWFGRTCIGVVPGSETHRQFERYAAALLSELPKH